MRKLFAYTGEVYATRIAWIIRESVGASLDRRVSRRYLGTTLRASSKRQGVVHPRGSRIAVDARRSSELSPESGYFSSAVVPEAVGWSTIRMGRQKGNKK